MKHVKYTIPVLAILFGLSFVFGPSFSRCSAWEDLTGTGNKKDDTLTWLALLLALGQGSVGIGTSGTDNLVVNETPPATGPKYYTLTAATTGFFDITLNKTGGTGARPEFYLTYLGDTGSPALGTCPAANWVTCDKTVTNPITFSNYFIGNGFSRQVGLNITAVPVTYTLQATRVGSVPQGCGLTFQNTSPLVNGSSTSNSFSNSSSAYNYIIVNNTNIDKTVTISESFNIAVTAPQDWMRVVVYASNTCPAASPTNDNTCTSTAVCSTSQTPAVKRGDFIIVTLQPIDGDGNGTLSGSYTLSVSY